MLHFVPLLDATSYCRPGGHFRTKRTDATARSFDGDNINNNNADAEYGVYSCRALKVHGGIGQPLNNAL
ncbi:hypothetical protein ZHAS_00015298 [Anopheles sinensis]|uniref:Uncharacterized protein n=1 Tax=Anopheles sinensis TaxID=74873 RepID=A0A084WAM6_ANOSI|nr:hypothetical protein ZHAS_00015298 [Anopheles sinensis]